MISPDCTYFGQTYIQIKLHINRLEKKMMLKDYILTNEASNYK